MPINVSVKNVPDEIIEKLRKRAQRNHRSLQGEMMSILEEATENTVPANFVEDSIVQRFNVSQERLKAFCQRHHIKKLSLFGSVLRDDFKPTSDIDVLVDFETGHVPGFSIVHMEDELSQLAGRKVDLRTAGDLSRHFRDRVVKESRVEYGTT